MAGNVNGQTGGGAPAIPDDLEYHDRLSRELRDYNNYSPLKLNSNLLGGGGWSLKRLNDEMPEHTRAATEATYGPDHPQARRKDV